MVNCSFVTSVLIETLWNVKRNCQPLCDHNVESINRNIVECKGVYLRSAVLSGVVLIETLWNVKPQPRQSLTAVMRY